MACNTITYKHTKYSSCGKDDELYGFFTQKVFNTPKRKIFYLKKKRETERPSLNSTLKRIKTLALGD